MAKLFKKQKPSKEKGLAQDLPKVPAHLTEPVSTLEIAHQYLVDGSRIFDKLIDREQDGANVDLLFTAKEKLTELQKAFIVPAA